MRALPLSPSLSSSLFGINPKGEAVTCWTLDSGTGVRAQILDHGGILHRLEVPDATGRAECVVLTLPALADYLDDNPYIGALVGRYANRIDRGRFTLDGVQHHTRTNDRGNTLHGGPDGFHRRVWHASPALTRDAASLRLRLHSPDGDMGFPGALDVTVVYTLDPAGTLQTATSCATNCSSTRTPTSPPRTTTSHSARSRPPRARRSTSAHPIRSARGSRNPTRSCSTPAATTTAGCCAPHAPPTPSAAPHACPNPAAAA